jgi:hypothetical protein
MIYTQEEKDNIAVTLGQSSRTTRTGLCKGFKGVKVGLWDVNHILPQLDGFAARLNSLQADFCFQSVEVSAPLGTWRRRSGSGGHNGTYINGAEVATKLHDHVVSLGVNRLICITTFGLADNEDQGLALWNLDKSQMVSIVSTELIISESDDSRTYMNRFLANMLVSALCGADGHAIPPKDCPNYSPTENIGQIDPKSHLAAVVGKRTLCPVCSKTFSKVVDSLNKILAAW